MPPFLHKVHITELLRGALALRGLDPLTLTDNFAKWKSLGDAGEYESCQFGKDGEYVRPTRNGARVLRHVHLPPATSPQALTRWESDFARRRRKTSDTCLVYAQDRFYGYLLIYIAQEPHGHELSAMVTPESTRLMNQFADVAEAFINDGLTII